MARKRDRIKRTFLLLIAVCVLAFLLELNRFLPGTWPGGGGGGFKAAGELVQIPDPTQEPEPDEEDTGAVAPPKEAPPSWPPPSGILVEVRGPDGSLETEWRLGSGSAGDEKPSADGRLRSSNARAREKGFRVTSKAGKLRHEHGVGAHVAAWSVHLPAAALPRQRDGGRAGLRIVDAVSGQPLPGAVAQWRVRDRKQTATADATGEAVVKPEYGVGAVRVRVSAKGYGDRLVWASPRDRRQREVALDKTISKRVKFVTAAGAMASVDISAYSANGRRLVVPVAPGAPGRTDVAGGYTWVDVPETEAATAWVAVRQRRPDRSDWVFHVPFKDLVGEMQVPGHKELSVNVKDVNGEPVRSATVWALPAPGSEGSPAPGEGARNGVRAAKMPARFDIARDRPFKLRVEVAGKAPIVRSYSAVDGNAPLEFVVEDGLMIPLRVVTEEGLAVPLADVVAQTSVEGVRIVRTARSAVDGRVKVGPFGRGPVEIFAKANGRAWAAKLVDARPAMATAEIEMQPGYPLHLVVEDPFGVPLRDVDVELSAAGGPPLVSPPLPVKRATDEGGRLTIEHVPNGLYTVRLSREGHHAEVLRRVQPGAVTYFATLVPR